MIILRPYQSDLITKTRSAFLAGYKSVLLVAPTGAGKTICFSYFCHSIIGKGKRALILVHRDELLDQISETLNQFKVPHSFVAPQRYYDPYSPVHVASVFSAKRRLQKLKTPDVLIIDEAHHGIKGSTWSAIFSTYPNTWKIGVTATPERLSGEGLADIYQKMILGPSVAELIKLKNLCDYRIYAPFTVNLAGVHKIGGDFIKSETEELMNKPSITGNALNEYRKIADGKRALIFCTSVVHAKDVAGVFKKAGYAAESIDGNLDKTIRRRIVADFKVGKIKILTNCQICTEGYDVPGIEVIILLRPTASTALCLQMYGRGLRTSPGKTHAIILDHVGACQSHGLPDDERAWTLEGRKKSSDNGKGIHVRICQKCFGAQRQGSKVCRYCGHEFEIQSREVEQRDGELTEIDLMQIRRQRLISQGKCQTLEELVAEGKRRGYRRPYYWARYVLQARQAKKLEGV